MSPFTLEADFLGTLAKVLADLQGYTTLANELIQNADDAKGDDKADEPDLPAREFKHPSALSRSPASRSVSALG